MKEVQDLNRIEYAIYYWSEVLAVLICGVFIYLNWQMGIICVASGYVVYKIMWFSRKSIFQMGLSRFYFFGIMISTYAKVIMYFDPTFFNTSARELYKFTGFKYDENGNHLYFINRHKISILFNSGEYGGK